MFSNFEMLFDSLVTIAVGMVGLCAYLSSCRLAISGFGHPSSNRWLRFLMHDRWSFVMAFFVVPLVVGFFNRGTLSPSPWMAFGHAFARDGVIIGLITAITVIVVELWLFWIPAHSYVQNRPDLDRRTIILARSLNLAIGLILTSPNNPLARLISKIPTSNAS